MVAYIKDRGKQAVLVGVKERVYHDLGRRQRAQRIGIIFLDQYQECKTIVVVNK